MNRKLFALSLMALTLMLLHRALADPATAPDAATTRVARGNLTLSLDMQGIFEPVGAFEARIRPREFHEEMFISKCAQNSSKVSRGDVLLELETDKIDAEIAAAENDSVIAAANLAKAQSDMNLWQKSDELTMANSKNELADALARVKRWDVIDGEIFVLAASMDAKVGDFNVDNATDELDQLHKMYKSEDLTSVTADIVVKRATRSLELQKLSDRVAHAVADKTSEVDAVIQRRKLVATADQQTQTETELQANQDHEKIIRQTSLITATAAAQQSQRKLARLKADREMFSIKSPIDGVLVYGSFDEKGWHAIDASQLAPGEKVDADHVLLTVYIPGKLRLRAACPESQIILVSPKSKLKITPTAMPQISYEGETEPVSIVGQGAANQQTFEVIADLPAVDSALAPGYSADAHLDGGKLENVLLLPVSAISKGTAWVIAAGQPAGSAVARAVVIGRSDGQFVEILSGLNEGDAVLTQAKHVVPSP